MYIITDGVNTSIQDWCVLAHEGGTRSLTRPTVAALLSLLYSPGRKVVTCIWSVWERTWPACISLVVQAVKKLPSVQGMRAQSLDWKDLLEKGLATHTSMLPCRIFMDWEAWWATVHEVAKSWTRLSEEHSLACLQGAGTLNYYFYTENGKEQAMLIKERMGLEAEQGRGLCLGECNTWSSSSCYMGQDRKE